MEHLQAALSDTAMHQLIQLVHDYTGITLSPAKRDMLQIRLRPRLRHLSLSSYEAYIDYLKTHKEEKEHFINRITTNETQFFRTQRVWEFLSRDFVPNWSRSHPAETLHAWSAAASSGEEAYSLAMVCEEYNKAGQALKYQIMGSDICTEVLASARAGEYSGRSLNNLSTLHGHYYSRYFKGDTERATVLPKLQQHITFKQHSLYDAPPHQRHFSLVLLRNVMIYFSDRDQERVLHNIAQSMKPGGVLIIGESESLSRLTTPFEYVEPLIYRLP